MSRGQPLIQALHDVAAEVSAVLNYLDDPRGSRPSTSQERRRLAEQAERTRTTLEAVCGDLATWIDQQPDETHQPDHTHRVERAKNPESACPDVTRAQDALDRARRDLQQCVETARGHGATWRQIGAALDITPQTAHKRFDPVARQRHAAYMRERNQRRAL